MRIILFEDDRWRNFLPLTTLRSIHELRCGILSLWEKAVLRLNGYVEALACRPAVADAWTVDRPDVPVNPPGSEPTLWLNARVLWSRECLDAALQLADGEAALDDVGAVLACSGVQDASDPDLPDRLTEAVRRSTVVDWPQLRAWYDLLRIGAEEIDRDARLSGFQESHTPLEMVSIMGEKDAWMGDGVTVGPHVTFDTREGPVIVDDGATLLPGVYLQGPCYIGKGTLVRANATVYEGCSIGKRCKIGGELHNVLMLAHANKQHEGYLGHAVMASWVNLGAATNNSDLKNTYGTVETTIDSQRVNTGLMFLGCCLGDHTKTAIATTLNTGTVTGIACNLFGAGFHPVYVPDFIWGQPGNYKEYLVEPAVATARTVLGRRHVEMTSAYERLLRDAFTSSREVRAEFLGRRLNRPDRG
jgi:UDP-N-acetylglucosamine diphosphorylase/glucosamine-1-phosphate N-acetyltransferase